MEHRWIDGPDGPPVDAPERLGCVFVAIGGLGVANVVVWALGVYRAIELLRGLIGGG